MLILMLIKSESTILIFFSILENFLKELILKTCIFKTCNNRYKQEKKTNVFATHFKEILAAILCLLVQYIPKKRNHFPDEMHWIFKFSLLS